MDTRLQTGQATMSETVVISAREHTPICWNPLAPVSQIYRYRRLILHLTGRDLTARYRKSFFGTAWAVITPFLVLAIYTFVFNVVLKARWGSEGGSFEFALALFCGLIVFNVFAECATVAPTLVVNHANFAKKTTFPLSVLPVVTLASALVRAGVATLVLAVGVLAFKGLSGHILLLPLAFVPLVMLTLGVGWLLAALGVFVQDVVHSVSLVVQLVFFMTPIVYPLESVPARLRPIIMANPFTHLVAAARDAVMWGRMPEWGWFLGTTVVCLAAFQVGYAFFAASRRAFADVL